MTGHLDRYGDPIEDDDQPVDNHQVLTAPGGTALPIEHHRDITVVAPTRDEIHSDRCAQLRAIIRAAKARREAQGVQLSDDITQLARPKGPGAHRLQEPGAQR